MTGCKAPPGCAEPKPMKDLTDARWIKLKGILFLLVGLLTSALLLIEHADLRTAVLLAIAVWCFCRFYYFAFYVIEHRWRWRTAPVAGRRT